MNQSSFTTLSEVHQAKVSKKGILFSFSLSMVNSTWVLHSLKMRHVSSMLSFGKHIECHQHIAPKIRVENLI